MDLIYDKSVYEINEDYTQIGMNETRKSENTK